MAEKFDIAEKRMFDGVFICRKCNARNRVKNPENASCRKCGYDGLRPKHSEITE
jgi:ribosomal protein L40E